MPVKQAYNPAMAEHLLYVQKQRHTRGDLKRAVKNFNGFEEKRLKGDVRVSPDIKERNAFDRGTVGNTRYLYWGKKPQSLGPRTCRVCKP